MSDWQTEPDEESGDLTPHVHPACICGCENFAGRQVGPHLGLYCLDCGKWLRWERIPVIHDPKWPMPFGEHKGKPISKLPTDYLEWGVKTLKGSMQERFQLALKARFINFGRCLAKACHGLIMRNGFGDVSLREACQAFCNRHNIDPGRFHSYLARYPKMVGDDPTAYRLIVKADEGLFNFQLPRNGSPT